MKYIGILLGAIALVACSAGAQAIQEDQSLTAWSDSTSFAYALLSATLFPSRIASTSEVPALALPAAMPAPQGPQGVHPDYNWDVYAGYNFVRFYALPNATLNTNGFDASIAYYFHGGWLGAEGEVDAAFGSITGKSSNLVLGGVGPHIRWSTRRGTVLWAHALAGGAHFEPLTPYGSQSAFAYEVGGGMDINMHKQRIAYRLEGDMVGTKFFSTEQYSPNVSAGIVIKF